MSKHLFFMPLDLTGFDLRPWFEENGYIASVIINRLMKDKKITYLVNGKMNTYFRSANKEKNCALCDPTFRTLIDSFCENW